MADGRVVDRVVNLVMWEKCVRMIYSKWTILITGRIISRPRTEHCESDLQR